MHNSKICFKCKIEKIISDFYKGRAMKDGHLNKCIECSKLDALQHRNLNLGKIREYDRLRGKLEHRKKINVENTKKSRLSIIGYTSSHSAVARALKKGSLIKQACCMCNSIMSIAHHDDYSKPLDVMWLCSVHHKSRHVYLKFLDSSKSSDL